MPDGDENSVEEVQKFIREQVNTFAQEAFNTYRQQLDAQQQQRQQPVMSQEDQYRQQLQQTINPFIEPGISHAQLTAADARDYVDFYTGNPDQLSNKEGIEKLFNDLKQQGRATNRQTIADYLDGMEHRTNPEVWHKRQEARHQAEADRAQLAADPSQGVYSKNPTDHPDYRYENFSKLSAAEQEKLLEGILF